MNPPPLPVQKRFPWTLYWIVLVLIVLVALAPVGSVVACGLIANAHGCRVDEGSVHPCVINGKDYGHLLYTLGVIGWLMLVTLPAGAFVFVLWLTVLIFHRANWQRRTVSIIGQDHMRAGEPKSALEIFKLNLLAYPWSADANDNLADAYLADGQKDLARQYAEKALALLDSHAAPASSWTDTEPYRGEIRRDAQKILKKLGERQR